MTVRAGEEPVVREAMVSAWLLWVYDTTNDLSPVRTSTGNALAGGGGP